MSPINIEPDALLITLHHKTVRNRTLDVRMTFDSSLPAPTLTSGTWLVPLDVVGLDSRKTKQVKVRFHPSLAELSVRDSTLTKTALEEARKFLDILLIDSQWSMKEICEKRPDMWHKFSVFLLKENTFVTVTDESFLLQWRTVEPSTEKEIRSHLQNPTTLVNSLVVEVTKTGGCNMIDIQSKKSNKSVTLMKISLIDPHLTEGVFTDVWQVSPYNLELRLPRTNTVPTRLSLPSDLSCVVFVDNKEHAKMLDASQLNVEILRRRLDESLASFQKSAAQKDRHCRSLHIVRVNEKEAIVEIGEHGARPRLDRILATSSPLNVICDGGATGDIATSPAESTDSGVSLSPVLSPMGKQSPFYEYSEENRMGMRQRSASESDWASDGLKGILKKPTTSRMGRFTRSVSESCHHEPVVHFPIMRSCTLEEEEEDEAYEEEEVTSEEREPRKKRVSFSEKLEHCRRFKPNQCIATQARKNEKKRQQKRRKEDEKRRMSCESEDDGASGDKPGLRSERQDSGFVDKEDDSPPVSPVHKNADHVWTKHVRLQRQIGAQ